MARIFPGILLLLISGGAFAQPGDAKILTKLNADWIHSYPTKDTAVLSKIFADDLILVNPSGLKMNKKDILRNVISNKQEIIASQVDSVEVKLYGDIGLVMATASFIVNDNGKPMTGRSCYLDVYQRRNGRWVAIVAHVTLLP